MRKKFYSAGKAHEDYVRTLSDSRSGPNTTTAWPTSFGELLAPRVAKGQSLHHVMATDPDIFTVSERAAYRYPNAGLLPVRRGDLPGACVLRPRRSKPVEHKVDKACRRGRNRRDYLKFMDENPLLRPVQMDSVIGRVGGKVLLTLMFPPIDFMLAFIRQRNDARSVSDVFSSLRGLIGAAGFPKLFPVILTDNGTEFSDPTSVEGRDKEFTRIFYCDPMMSNQKAQCERNHEFIRMVLPKGTPFDDLSQPDIDLMMSHINSYTRPSIGDCTPIDLFGACFGSALPRDLNLGKIPADEILLKPALLKK